MRDRDRLHELQLNELELLANQVPSDQHTISNCGKPPSVIVLGLLLRFRA